MNTLIQSIAAGMMISFACIINLTVNNPIASPLFFSIGLLLICYRKYYLYTGKVRYLTSIPQILKILFGNTLGVLIVRIVYPINTQALVAAKLQKPIYIIFIYSIFCGLLMFIAVDTFINTGTPIGIIAAVPAFIICGFEHSIADMYYFSCAPISLKSITYLIVIIIGNAIGANLHRLKTDTANY